MKAQFSHMHWVLVLLTSVLIVILTLILNLLVVLLVLHIRGRSDQEQIATQVAFWSPSILPILLTGVCAEWVARKVEREPQLHGFLVGLIAALILFLLSSGFHGEFVLVTSVTFVLTIAAGWLGGSLGSRGLEKS